MITPREVAQRAGCVTSAVWYAIQKGTLLAVKSYIPNRKRESRKRVPFRLLIDENTATEWINQRKARNKDYDKHIE